MRTLTLVPLLLVTACCCGSGRDPFEQRGRDVPWDVYGTDLEFAFTRCTVHEVPVPAALAGGTVWVS